MTATSRFRFPVSLALAVLVLAACRTTRRTTVAGRPGPVCLPPLETPASVGTEVGEIASKDFVLRVHDVRDILDLMPVVQLVGPGGTRTVPPEDSLIAGLLQELDAQERSITNLRATGTGAVIVKAPPPIQERVAEALHRYRLDLVRRHAEVGSPPASGPFQAPPKPTR